MTMCELKKLWVTDVIGDDYKKWSNGDTVFIDCQTGRGKTYFILNVFAKYLKKMGKTMLVLSNRTKLNEQMLHDNDNTNVTCMTYQFLQAKLLNGKDIELYDVIVSDEAHYYLTDSFNRKTEKAFNYVLNSNAIKVYMSATGQDVIKLLNVDYRYSTDNNYSYINKFVVYNDNDYIINLINTLPENEKLIYFANNVKSAYDMYLRYSETKSVSFVCSKSNKNYSKYITEDAIIEEKFNSQILIATTCIDNGINLKDRAIKHIITDLIDDVNLIQCIGRKRIIDNDDKVNVYIKEHSKATLNRFANSYRHNLDIADKIKDDDFNIEDRDSINIPSLCYKVGNVIKVDEMGYTYSKIILEKLEKFMEEGFGKVIIDYMTIDEDKVEYISETEECEHKSTLQLYLESIEGKKLLKDSQEELIGMIDIKIKGVQQRGIKNLNYALEQLKLDYVIDSKRCTIDGKKITYWIVKKYNLNNNE